ncbi:unnamed protein product [Cyprideis torosa]|uniref:Uncharacterized protein n=1 Tax=Cyprideis torosa TaxID=163714 RepID=A0A7R8WHA1_9CRUS|nr:unnamed protein product [Cyprideis torosa]CAG0893941.1 unnamed protein product [Cyprideis torosa]
MIVLGNREVQEGLRKFRFLFIEVVTRFLDPDSRFQYDDALVPRQTPPLCHLLPFYLTYHLVLACEAQLKLMPIGVENLVLISDEARQRAFEQSRRGGGGGVDSREEEEKGPRRRKFGVGEMEFEALMRMLDNTGYRTGYMYRQPLTRSDAPKSQSDVELPPASSSYAYAFDENDLFQYSPLKKFLEGKRSADRSKWINSPNSYQKVEVLETNTTDPKKIIKWVPDSSSNQQGGTPVRLADPLQFVPKNTTAKEFKQKQKQMKEWRRAGEKTAGPQSHVLDGVSWDEAKTLVVSTRLSPSAEN